ncbi:hypothetical protein F2Q70_00015515 [Brassica cretica]|uniref:Uncharacterized protein n=1 Tax=Brassica cretica TaxID=69181 RepID=A0A8S9I482_BRACR|nr:hypothetical protein F2Q70_00015515 [Brassica cretica]
MILKLFSKDSPLNTSIISDVIIDQVYKVLVIGNSKERKRFENQWVKFYRLQRRLEGGGSWRLEYVKEI